MLDQLDCSCAEDHRLQLDRFGIRLNGVGNRNTSFSRHIHSIGYKQRGLEGCFRWEAFLRKWPTESYVRASQMACFGSRAVNKIQVSRESGFFIKSKAGGDKRAQRAMMVQRHQRHA